ncbi:MAG: amino acid adenylation domain-containing protein, partial [Candidatus Aminicenantes bacterium]
MADRDISGNLTIAASEYNKEKNYWLKKLSGEIQKSFFPYDHSKTGVKWAGEPTGKAKITGAAETARTNVERLSEEVFTKLVKLSRNSDYVLHMIFVAGAAAILYKYTGSRDIILGTPIYKQEKDADFLNTVLPLRVQLEKHTNFKELLVQVRQVMVEANENQNYPLETLLYQLNMPISPDEFPLFDVAVLLENIHDKRYILHTHPRVIFSFLRTHDHIEAWVEYSALLYEKSTIQRIAGHFKRLIEAAVVQIDTPLPRLDIIVEEEKKQLLVEFNDTRRDYPDSKSIHDLFAEQAARTPDHTALTYEGEPMTYRMLNEKADALAAYLQSAGIRSEEPAALLAADTHDVITALLGILKAGGAYLPLNADYPPERQKYILNDCSAGILLTNYHDSPHYVSTVIDLEDENIYRGTKAKKVDAPHPGNHLAYIIYTSGSTGEPKGVMVEHRSVVRLVKNTDYIKFEEGDSILLTGALEFDASTFEIWGALLNGLTLHLMRKENMLTPHRFKKTIAARGVTTMWLTSPLFNQMLDMDIQVFAGLKKLLVGGDVLSPPHINRLRDCYPELTVINGYGPTENTTFSTTYQIKSIHEENIPIGKPIANSTAYILDDFYQPAPIGVAGELFVGGAGLARGYLNNPELTAEKFDHNLWNYHYGNHESYKSYRSYISKKLYKTGDLARWQPDGNIEFLGRRDQQVKIRGFRIEPGEIENYLTRQPGVKEAVVVDRKTIDGDKYLCAYVIPGEEKADSLDTVELRKILSRQLPDYMVPAYFVVLREIPLTANGKVNRRALPEPEVRGDIRCTAPKNPIEHKFVEIWFEVLKIDKEKIGIDTNFFELGGHSLKAAVLIAKIHQAFNIKIPLAEIFGTPTIRELAQYVKGMTEEKFVSIEPVEEKEYYELSSAQKRMYVLQEIQPGNTTYNIPAVYILEGNWEPAKMEETFRKLIVRHESLRTSFELINEIPVQVIHRLEKLGFKIENHSAGRKVQGTGTEQEPQAPDTMACTRAIKKFIRPFDLSRAPLIRVELIRIEEKRQVLMVDMHHIITDGTSMDIFVKEFKTLYTGEELPPLRLQYKDFTGWQNSGEQKQALRNQEEYWLKQFESEIPVLDLPVDSPRPPVQSYEGSVITFELSTELTRALDQMASENEATLYMVLLTIYSILLAKLSGQEDIVVGSPIAARRHADLEHVVGMFVNTLALRNRPNRDKTFIQFLKEIKEKTLAAFEYQDYPFEELVEQVVINRDASRNPLFDVMLAFQDWAAEEPVITNLKMSPYEYENNTSKFDMTLGGGLQNEQLYFTLEYSTKLFNQETILRFTRYFKQIISIILENPHKKISAIEIASEEEKRQILVDFNETASEYPKDKTIPGLFEEQVNRTPHRAAITQHNQALSYQQLKERSNQLAHLLRQKGVQPDTITGIMAERSIEMVIGIVGILKAGAAYLPIDPDYPEDRINYILADSGTKILLAAPGTQVKVKAEVEESSGQPPQLPLEFIDIETKSASTFERPPSTLTSTLSAVGPVNLAYIIYTSGSTGMPKGVLVTHQNVTNLVLGLKNRIYVSYRKPLAVCLIAPYVFDASVKQIFATLLLGHSLYIVLRYTGVDGLKLAEFYKRYNIDISDGTPTHLRLLLENVNFNEKNVTLGIKHFIIGGEELPREMAKNFFNRFQAKGLVITNVYGPTECCVDSTSYDISKENVDNHTILPIGTPMPNQQVYIVDNHNKLQLIGVSGELCIGGMGVSRGYLNQPERTAEKFCRKNFLLEGTRGLAPLLYRTGDLARWLPDGNIEFLGRLDHQVKIRGFRIELSEIEYHLLNHNEIKEAVVVSKQDTIGNMSLYAYFVSGKELTIAELRNHLSGSLPDYMLPSFFIKLDTIPLTPNGKVDRKRLPETGAMNLSRNGVYIGPRNTIEKKLAEVWQKVLGINAISINDNFFQVGGDSIKTIQIVSRMKKSGYKIEMKDIFRNPRIVDLAPLVKKIERIPDQSASTGTLPLTPIQKLFWERKIKDNHHFNQ